MVLKYSKTYFNAKKLMPQAGNLENMLMTVQPFLLLPFFRWKKPQTF